MFQFSTAHWCERKDWCGFGASGSRSLPSRTYAQNGKRLAGYADFASTELTVDCFRAADHPYLRFGEESRSFIRRIVVVCELACFP